MKTATYVIDTSVLLKPLLKEEGKEIVYEIFKLKDSFKLSILLPDIFRYEFFNTASRKKDLKTARRAFEEIVERQVSIMPLEQDLMDMAGRLMEKYRNVSFYDTAYHVLAKAYDITFITADKKYYEITKKEGNIQLLEDLRL